MSIKLNNSISFKDLNIRLSGTKEDPLFCGKDLCDLLGLKNSRSSIALLSKSQRVSILCAPLENGQKMTYVNESGLYRLVMKSRKEESIEFQNWICNEVLPTIRKYGQYPKPENEKIEENNRLYLTNETELHYKVVEYIREYCPNLLITASLGEFQDTKEKRIEAYKKGYIGGMPDIIIFDKSGNYNSFVIELKTPTGKGVLSLKQKDILKEFENRGSKVLISNDIFEIITELKDYNDNIKYVKKIKCDKCNKSYCTVKALENHKKKLNH